MYVYQCVLLLVSLFQVMYARAVWIENGKEEEGVIPYTWIEKNLVRWPKNKRTEAHKYSHPPQDDWLAFTLVKTKLVSGKLFIFYDSMVTLS